MNAVDEVTADYARRIMLGWFCSPNEHKKHLCEECEKEAVRLLEAYRVALVFAENKTPKKRKAARSAKK